MLPSLPGLKRSLRARQRSVVRQSTQRLGIDLNIFIYFVRVAIDRFKITRELRAKIVFPAKIKKLLRQLLH